MKYFVSYTTRDGWITPTVLRRFSQEIARYGKVFIDLIDNNSIDKQARVFSELDQSNFLLLIETTSVYQSEWVLLELERANLLRIPIIKFSIDELSRPAIIQNKIQDSNSATNNKLSH